MSRSSPADRVTGTCRYSFGSTTHIDAVDIGRHFHHYRALPAILYLGKGAPHDVRDLLGQDHLFDRFGDRSIGTARSEHREQLRRLARVTERQKHHRARIRKGGRDAGERVLRARPVLHREHARRAAIGDARETVGHMDADSLLAADDRLDPDRCGGLDDRGGRKAEERRDALPLQDLGNHVHDEHRWFLPTVIRGAGGCAGRQPKFSFAGGSMPTGGRRADSAPLERHAQSEPHREWVDRFEMDVVDGRCLVRQLGGIEIVDLMGAGVVEQVEDVQPYPGLLGKFVADT